jgi:beta-glucosidase
MTAGSQLDPVDSAADSGPRAATQPGAPGLPAALPATTKAHLLTGADAWRTSGYAEIGLRPMVTSDGPSGVRGTTKDERKPSASLPCPSALGATWDADLVYRLACALGHEARSKGVDVLLAPTVNLMRTPLGGRGFECFAEDPVLTAVLASAYVRGVQQAGVAAAVKHFVGNDTETGRWVYDARIAESVLREMYLVPFEACVREAGAQLVMAAYNKVDGERMTENARLLRDVLKREWGFAGVVISDWGAARSTLATALAGLDLSMPGPDGPWGAALAEAVADGLVPEELLDDKVARLLRLARWAGALASTPAAATDGHPTVDGHPPVDGHPTVDGHAPVDGHALADGHGTGPVLADPALLRHAAAESFVLLRNAGGILPLDPRSLASLAVAGPNAVRPTIQGGGSAGVIPAQTSNPADALRAALDGQAAVSLSLGCQTFEALPDPPAGSLRDPVTGEPGVWLEFIGADGSVLAAESRGSANLTWWDGVPAGIGWGEPGTIVLSTLFRADTAAVRLIGAAGVGRLTLTGDGVMLADAVTVLPDDPVQAMTRPGEVRARLWLDSGTETKLRLEFRPAPDGEGPLAIRLGIAPAADDETLLAEAEAAAAAADAAVVVVGSAELTESEGFDRSTLALPGRQDELVARIAAVNSKTIVVVNSGTPVLTPWADQVAAILYAWLPGQEFGNALADVLLGTAEPGGRLPVTVPAAEADCPVLHAVPSEDGILDYSEGLLIGYRGYDANGVTPKYPFGHGLGYTTWTYESLDCPPSVSAGRDLQVGVTVRNTGTRPGKEVIQAYLAGPGTEPDQGRPPRALAAFAVVRAAPGEKVRATLTIPARAFARYDQLGGWAWPSGEYVVQAGRSSRDLPLSAPVLSAPPPLGG